MIDNEIKYVHDEFHHNLTSPEIIVSKLLQFIKPQSVVDVGCGIGTFLYVFKNKGVKEVLGIDGPWVNKELLNKYLDKSEFIEANLEKPICLNKKFDLAISLEVAEHLEEAKSDIFVESLISLSDVIVFSAAFPKQGGQNHVNEQWPEYWSRKFNRFGYIMLDVIRPLIWNESEVQSWYKQNIFLVVKKEKRNELINLTEFNFNNLDFNFIHFDYYKALVEFPEKYYEERELNNKITSGEKDLFFYVKMIIKKLLHIFKLRR